MKRSSDISNSSSSCRVLSVVLCSLLVGLGSLLITEEAAAHRPHDCIFAHAISPEYGVDQELFCAIDHLTLFILKTNDEGQTWRPSQKGIQNELVTAVAYSPTYGADRTLFAGTNEGKVYRSIDGGGTWILKNNGLPVASVTCIALSPNFVNDRTVLLGIDGAGIFGSTNAGWSWTSVGSNLTNVDVNDLCFSPDYSQDQTVFAATSFGLLRSINGGAAWFPFGVGLPASPLTSVRLSPDYVNDNEMFVGTFGDGFYHSTDAGANWMQRINGMTDLFVVDLAVSPTYSSDANLFVVCRDTGVFASQDAGQSWALFEEGLEWRTSQAYGNLHFRSILISPNFGQDKTLFVGMFEGMFKSIDSGQTWFELDLYPPHVSRSVTLSPDFPTDQKVFYSTYGGGNYRSLDGGATWSVINRGLSSRFVYPIEYVSSDHQALFSVQNAITDEHGRIARSLDDGESFINRIVEPVYTQKPTLHALAFSPGFLADKIMFVGNRADGRFPFYRSTNAGQTFTSSDPGFRAVVDIAVSPRFATDSTLFVGTEQGVFVSYDGGLNFSLSGLDGKVVLCLEMPVVSAIFAGTQGDGLWRSLDSGVSWEEINEGLDDLVVEALEASPVFASDHTLFASTMGYGVFKSTNAGGGWNLTTLEGTFVQDLALSPGYAADETVFAAGWDGIYKSIDGGASWTPVSYLVRYEEGADNLISRGTWSIDMNSQMSCSALASSVDPGAKITIPFVGNSVTWVGTKGPDHGVAKVYWDGQELETVDLYSKTIDKGVELYNYSVQEIGFHQFGVKVTPYQNPESIGNIVTVDAFDIVYR